MRISTANLRGDPEVMIDGLLKDFDAYDFEHAGIAHEVYAIGKGPPILVMHELPGFGPPVVNFARRLAEAGFQVHLPHLFGTLGKREAYKNYRALCISREFSNLAAGVSAPVTAWLRALTKRISTCNDGCNVGAIGMCLTGSFVIPLVLDPWVTAPVASQPAVPFSLLYLFTGLGEGAWAQELNVCDKDLAAAAKRLHDDNRRLLAFRFQEDRLCPHTRFERLEQALGSELEAHEYGGSSLLKRCFSPRHSILTEEYDKAKPLPADDPTRDAFERVCSFMHENLARDR